MRSLLAVPLVEGRDPLGVVALVSYGDGGTFDEQSLEMLETFADQIRLMLHNARLFDAFSDRYLETVKGLARSLDARRLHTRGHHEATARAADAIAAALRLGAAEADAVHTAALVHDVGMAAAAGTEGGFESDIEHPTVGASLIEHIPLHRSVASGVATHHEWFDGWGFPQGVRGDAIPLSGRILGVAEFVVEMSTGEEVRPPWSAERLAFELRRRRGSQFDPDIADVAVRLVEDDALGLAEIHHHDQEDAARW
jgi:HD-GYP domain-containing protein (c-di-GMP phosphodiesterase class II)